jgi:hypothetical protein
MNALENSSSVFRETAVNYGAFGQIRVEVQI